MKKRIETEKQVVRLPVIGRSRRVGLLQTWSAFSCWAHHHHSTIPLHLVLLRSALAVTEAQHAVGEEADLVPAVRIVPAALLGGQGSKVYPSPLGDQPTTHQILQAQLKKLTFNWLCLQLSALGLCNASTDDVAFPL